VRFIADRWQVLAGTRQLPVTCWFIWKKVLLHLQKPIS